MSRKQIGGILIFCVISWTFALACLTAAGRMNEARQGCGDIIINDTQVQPKECMANSDPSLFYEDMLTHLGFWAILMPFFIGFSVKWVNDRDEAKEKESIKILS